MAKWVKTNQGLYNQSSLVGRGALRNSSFKFQHKYNRRCVHAKKWYNAMWLSRGQAVGTKTAHFTERHGHWVSGTHVSESFMYLACLKVNCSGQINSCQRVVTGVTFIEKRWLSSAACVTSFIYLFVYIEGTTLFFFPSSTGACFYSMIIKWCIYSAMHQ